MANDFQILIKSFIWITLFAFLIIGFTIQLASNYGKDTSQIQSELGASGVNSTITSMTTVSNTWSNVFFKQNIYNPFTVAGVVLTTMFNLLATMFNFILIPFTLFGGIATNVLKIPAVVMNMIYTLIIVTVIFSVWRLIRTGY